MPVILRFFLQRVVKAPPAPLRVAVLLFAVLAYGATGFLYFELSENPELGWLDAIWYSVVTLTTVGYGDLYPKTLGGRFVVAVPMMFFGIGLLGYVLSLAASALVTAKNKELSGMAAFELENHLVIFNFPGLAKLERVLDELARDPAYGRRDTVLIDDDLESLPVELDARGLRFVRGNPTRDETLSRASVDSAAYAVVLSRNPGDPRSDDLNVAITLAIEGRTARVHTVVECTDFSTRELLRKAGCDSIVCSSRFDAHFLSQELLNPGIQEVLEELTTNSTGQQIYMTRYDGQRKSFAELAKACRAHGHLAIGVRRRAAVAINVEPERTIEPGDHLITIGASRPPALG